MKKNFTLFFTMLFLLIYTGTKAQTLFWSDTFEDTNAPSAGTRFPSYNTGGPSSPYTYYFLRTDGSNISLQPFSTPETSNLYQGKEGTKFWAGEDLDRVGTGSNNPADKIQNITWTGITILGKSGVTFKGLFAANSGHDWQDIVSFPTTYDFMEVEYRIDGGPWILAGGIYPESSASGGLPQRRLRIDTNGDKIGDGAYITRTFQEIGWNITGTGTILDLRFRVNADAGTTQEFAIDNFRLFEAPACVPPAIPTVTTIAATCSGNGTATISNYSAALTYTSTPAGATVGALGAITGTAGTAYTFTATNAPNCTSAASASVAIPLQLAAPVVPTVSTTPATCSGNGTASIANYSAALTYTSTPAGATVGSLGAITGTVGTAYTFTATNASGCTSAASASVAIPMQLATPAVPTVSTTPATCSANGTASIANYSVALTYTSTPAGATVGALGAIAGTAGTAYTFTATNASGCTSGASASVAIPMQLAAPVVPTVSTTPATCSANGTASIANYSAALTYTSTPTGATVGALGAITGTTGTAYTFTATNASGCTSGASASVAIPMQLAAPIVPTVSTTPATCSANGTASISNYSAALTYTSTPAGATVGALGAIAGTAGTAYTFTATNASGCTSAVSASVAIPLQLAAPAVPTVSTTPATCSANGTASIANYSAALTYTSTPTGATVGALGAIAGTAGTAYTFTATNASGCTSAASASVAIPLQLAAPVVPTVSTTPATCSANGTASIANYSAALTYTSTPAGATVGALGAIAGTAGTAYTFTATNASGCTSAASASVAIPLQLAAPVVPTVSTTPATCSANGTASIANYSAALTYTSTPAGATVGALGAITGTAGTAYNFTATNASGCTSGASASVAIAVQLPALIDTVTLTTGVLTADQPGAIYQWIQCPSSLLTGENGQSFTPTALGSYAVLVTIGTCSTLSSCINVTTLGNPDFEEKSKFVIYPNPNKGILNIESDDDADLSIVNQLGQTVKTEKVSSDIINTFNIEGLADGVYFVNEKKGNKVVTHKLILNK
jgi:hypothetical protein